MTEARRALVTGGGSGIGRAIAVALASAGFDVVIAGRRSEVLRTVCDEIRDAVPERRVAFRVTDVGVAEECDALVEFAIETLGGLDAVVNAAAICESVDAADMTAGDWTRTLDVNVRGSALISATAARHMRVHGGGRIVLFSSINGAISEPSSAPYSASKAAVSSLARSFAVDMGADGVTVNAIAPGWVHTAMTADFLAQATADDLARLNPLGRLGLPEEIADVVVYLATRAPTFLTGTTLFIDGGQTAAAVMP